MLLVPVTWYMWVGPVSGLEVAPESFQIHRREVSSDAFSQPPLTLRCTGSARLAELIPEMFTSDPPGRISPLEGVVVEQGEDCAVVGQQASCYVDHPLTLLIGLEGSKPHQPVQAVVVR